MGGITSDEQAAMAHRRRDEAAHRRHALLHDVAFSEPAALIVAEPLVQLLPDPVVGPVRNIVVVRALKVEPAQHWRPHGE